MRIAAKTATYSMMHLTVAVAVAYALTRDLRVALAVGMIEPVFQTAAFFLHERLWSRADKKKAAIAPRPPPEGLPLTERLISYR